MLAALQQKLEESSNSGLGGGETIRPQPAPAESASSLVRRSARCEGAAMARKTGFDALVHFVAARWCMGDSLGDPAGFRRFIPGSGTVTADQFVEWVCLASAPEVRGPEPRWQRARTEIRAAFIEHMGGETVDASALVWADEYLPLPDSEAFAQNLTEEELFGYREEFGEGSREWIIARNELRRRGRLPRSVREFLWAAASLLVIAYFLWRWLGPGS